MDGASSQDSRSVDGAEPRPVWWGRGLASVFALAMLVRVTGLYWGGVYYDEAFGRGAKVLSGHIVPDQLWYPPLLDYLNAVAYAVLYGVGRLLGIWLNTTAFRSQYFDNRTPFILTARLVTGTLGAFAAPLATLIARQVRLSWRAALLVGVMMAVLPIGVIQSHVVKSETGMTTALLLTVWALGHKLADPDSRRADLLFGFASALALSFKHSAVFVLAGLWLALAVSLSLIPGRPVARVGGSLARAGLSAVFAWIPMNIGLLLDLKTFLYFQTMQQKLAQRPSSLKTFMQSVLPALASTHFGATLPVLVAGIAAPLVRRDRLTLWIWSTTMLGLAVLASIVGDRVPANFVLPFASLLCLLGGLTAATLLSRPGLWRGAGLVATVLILGQEAIGTNTFLRQTLLPSSYVAAAQAIEKLAVPNQTRIMTNVPTKLGLPLTREVLREEYQRQVRLATKYGVKLPPTAPERIGEQPGTGVGYHIHAYSTAGGLEDVPEEQFSEVKAFWWPLQKEEWELQYWLDRSYTLFVVENEPGVINSGPEPCQRFFQDMKRRGRLVADLPNHRPLLWEPSIRIYQVDPTKKGPG